MSSIINVFENLLKYINKEIFIILDINNEIYFKRLVSLYKLIRVFEKTLTSLEIQIY